MAAQTFPERIQYVLLRIFFSSGLVVGIFPFYFDGSRFTPSNVKLQLIALLLFVSVNTYGAFDLVYFLSKVISIDLLPSNSAIYLISVYAIQSVAYYLNILAFAYISAFRRKHILKLVDQIVAIQSVVKGLKLFPRSPKVYAMKIIYFFLLIFLSIATIFTMMYFRMSNISGVFTIFVFVFQSVVYTTAISIFWGIFLYFTYVYEVIVHSFRNVERTIYNLMATPALSEAHFTTQSCELSDRIDELVKLQMQLHLCIRKSIKLLQFPLLIVIFVTLLSCIASVTDAYIRVNLVLAKKIETPQGLLMAMAFLGFAFLQLHYIVQGPQMVLEQHRRLVQRINTICVSKIEKRLDRSVSVMNFF